jgi:methyl-accepting chemotaxis protein
MRASLSVGQKLLLSAALGVLLVVVVGAVALQGLSQVDTAVGDALVYTRALRNQGDADMMHDALRGDVYAARLAAHGGAPQGLLDDAARHAITFREAFAQHETLLLDPSLQTAIRGVRPAVERYITLSEQLVESAVSRGAVDPAAQAEFEAAFDTLEREMAEVSDRLEAAATSARAASDLAGRRARTVTLAVSVLAAVSFAGAAFAVARHVTRRVRALAEAAGRLAHGEIRRAHVAVDGADEIAALGAAFNDVTAYLSEMVETAGAISRGDLGQTVRLRSDEDALGRAFNEMSGYLRAMANAAQAISQGDIRSELAPTSDRDVLGWAFSEMTGYLRSMARTAQAIAKGDLRAEVHAKGERDMLGHAFGNMIAGLRGLVGEVRADSSRVAQAAAEIAQSSGQASHNADAGATAIEGLTSTMLELSANVQEVAEHAQGQAASAGETAKAVVEMVGAAQRISERGEQLAALARKSGDAVVGGQAAVGRSEAAVVGGRRAVERSATGMARISTAIGGSAETVETLGRRAQEIGRIVGLIDEITARTNLLALNAAIIAAQAGEQGRSFGVVASEVRTLAERSAGATKEIGGLIASIQEEALAAVAQIQASRDAVLEGISLGEELKSALGHIDVAGVEVRDSLSRIAETVTAVSRYSEEIGAATREQAAGGAQVSREVARLADIAQQIQKATREQAAGAGEVARLAEQMKTATRDSASAAAATTGAAGVLSSSAGRLGAAVSRFHVAAGGTPA